MYYEGKTDEPLTYIKTTKQAFLGFVGGKLSDVKQYIDTDCIDVLEDIQTAIIDLARYSQFSLIEPNNVSI